MSSAESGVSLLGDEGGGADFALKRTALMKMSLYPCVYAQCEGFSGVDLAMEVLNA